MPLGLREGVHLERDNETDVVAAACALVEEGRVPVQSPETDARVLSHM